MDDLSLLETNYQLHRNCGQKFIDQGNLPEAIQSFKRAVECLVKIIEMTTDKSKREEKLKTARDLMEINDMLHNKIKASQPKAEANASNKKEDDKAEQKSAEYEVAQSTGVTFDDVIGCDDVKEFVRLDWVKRFDPKYDKAFSGKYSTDMERGILLYGCPGTGKTMLAQAIASEVDAVFYSIDCSKIIDKYVGETEKAITRLFDQAAKEKRAIIFIDEIDSILAEPTDSSQNFEQSALNQWLKMMDGFDKKKVKNIIVIGATNYPDKIAPSALRHKRLGAHFRVDLPNFKLRMRFINSKLDKDLLMPDVNFEAICKELATFSAADIIAVCNRIVAISRQKVIDAIDKGLDSYDCRVGHDEIAELISSQHSSVSQKSVLAIEKFEKNLNINNPRGSVQEYMQFLKTENR